ncbi:GNAT family N-acetyltransferase [Plantactinospora sp. GCM10030261]|uniref:GNAT family N-acetyltransferase n=1 Tax=Plantactinospora sp. GCM10030261 TaxID=3273420 RepID=UPI00361B251F
MSTPYLREDDRVGIRRLDAADRAAFLTAARASTSLHHPWLLAPTTEAEFDATLAACDRRTKEGLLVCDRQTGDLAGWVNINNIIRGRFQCGSLGYGAFLPYAGKGYLRAGLALVIQFAFADLDLHRLEANIQPGNTASINLVRRLGFRHEGFSPDMLFIDGAWRDHERFAILSSAPQPPDLSPPSGTDPDR